MKNQTGYSSGYTLVELAVTLSIIGILAMIAIPNFQAVIPRYKFQSDVRILATNLNLVRLQAISKNREYKIALNTGSNSYAVYEGNSSDIPQASLGVSGTWTFKYSVQMGQDTDLYLVDSLGSDSAIFYPNGTLDERLESGSGDGGGAIELQGAGIQIRIQIAAPTGRINTFRNVGGDWKDERFLKG